MNYRIHQLRSNDLELMDGLLDCFGEAFDEPDTYGSQRPDETYLRRLLSGPSFIGLVAVSGGRVIGGAAAYELPKFEQPRSEIYLYDLAVSAPFRRQGIATALLERLKEIARSRGAWVVFVQAEHGNDPAIALYNKLGREERVLNFDILLGNSEN